MHGPCILTPSKTEGRAAFLNRKHGEPGLGAVPIRRCLLCHRVVLNRLFLAVQNSRRPMARLTCQYSKQRVWGSLRVPTGSTTSPGSESLLPGFYPTLSSLRSGIRSCELVHQSVSSLYRGCRRQCQLTRPASDSMDGGRITVHPTYTMPSC